MTFMPVDPESELGKKMQPIGLYEAAKKGVPGYFADLGVHIFGKANPLLGGKVLQPKSKVGKAIVKAVYGEPNIATGAMNEKHSIISNRPVKNKPPII